MFLISSYAHTQKRQLMNSRHEFIALDTVKQHNFEQVLAFKAAL